MNANTKTFLSIALVIGLGSSLRADVMLDFNSLAHGETVASQFALSHGVTISANNENRSFDLAIAFDTAMLGTPAGKVDDAVRAYYETLGYGPGYATPGLSHRTGHGIGMDGHERVNFVHGEKTPLAPGMCFSN